MEEKFYYIRLNFAQGVEIKNCKMGDVLKGFQIEPHMTGYEPHVIGREIIDIDLNCNHLFQIGERVAKCVIIDNYTYSGRQTKYYIVEIKDMFVVDDCWLDFFFNKLYAATINKYPNNSRWSCLASIAARKAMIKELPNLMPKLVLDKIKESNLSQKQILDLIIECMDEGIISYLWNLINKTKDNVLDIFINVTGDCRDLAYDFLLNECDLSVHDLYNIIQCFDPYYSSPEDKLRYSDVCLRIFKIISDNDIVDKDINWYQCQSTELILDSIIINEFYVYDLIYEKLNFSIDTRIAIIKQKKSRCDSYDDRKKYDVMLMLLNEIKSKG